MLSWDHGRMLGDPLNLDVSNKSSAQALVSASALQGKSLESLLPLLKSSVKAGPIIHTSLCLALMSLVCLLVTSELTHAG